MDEALSSAGLSAAEDSGPAYRRVKEHVLGHIIAGDWSAGERIPSEQELRRQFGVARMTVHRALRELTEEGYLTRAVGAGTFVADRTRAPSSLSIRDVVDEAHEAGLRCRSRIVSQSHGRASPQTAARLGIAEGAGIFCTTVARWLGSMPIQYEERWVVAELAPTYPGHDFERSSPAEVLARLFPELVAAHEVRAIVPKGKIRTLLAMQAADACLLLSTRLALGDTAVSVADFYHPGNRYALPGKFI